MFTKGHLDSSCVSTKFLFSITYKIKSISETAEREREIFTKVFTMFRHNKRFLFDNADSSTISRCFIIYIHMYINIKTRYQSICLLISKEHLLLGTYII